MVTIVIFSILTLINNLNVNCEKFFLKNKDIDDKCKTLIELKKCEINEDDNVYPEDFGAVGDGLIDDTDPIQKAIIYAGSKSKKVIILKGKVYKIKSINVISDIYGDGIIKFAENQDNIMLKVAKSNIVIKNITLDYNNNKSAFGYGCLNIVDYDSIKIISVKFLNADCNAIYVKRSNNGKIKNCVFRNINGESIFLHGGCNNFIIERNEIKKSLKDGIKVHSHDGVIKNSASRNITIVDNIIDFSDVKLEKECLGIEIWRGDLYPESLSNNHLIRGNTVIGSKVIGSADIWGISLDNTDETLVIDNKVKYGVKYAYEAAACKNIIFKNNYAFGYTKRGYSISKNRTYNISIKKGVVAKASSYKSVYGVEAINGKLVIIDSVIFENSGERAIFYNNGGNRGMISNCRFIVGTQYGNMICVYLYKTTKVTIKNNVCMPKISEKNRDFGVMGVWVDLSNNFTISGNKFDGRKALTLEPMNASCIYVGNKSEGFISHNFISNYLKYAIDSPTIGSNYCKIYNNNSKNVGLNTGGVKYNITSTVFKDNF
ncbi:hypothetical protein GCM10027347_32260 [Larkinella harenae]